MKFTSRANVERNVGNYSAKSAPHDLSKPVVRRHERILHQYLLGQVSLTAQVATNRLLHVRRCSTDSRG
jgi:hypothetical protein